jgi:hypothetical protein
MGSRPVILRRADARSESQTRAGLNPAASDRRERAAPVQTPLDPPEPNDTSVSRLARTGSLGRGSSARFDSVYDSDAYACLRLMDEHATR